MRNTKMQLIRDIKKSAALPSALVIGNFDGLHLGHQAIIRQLVSRAKAENLIPSVMTFHPHPRATLHKAPFYRLSTFTEKLLLLKQWGIVQVFCLRFNENFANLSAEDFISQYLVAHCQVRTLLVGEDFRFGYQRQGHFGLLEKAGTQYNFTVEAVNLQEIAGQKISSSRIREALLKGQLQEVKALLGRHYSFHAKVIRGAAQGRLLGFPTANLKMPRLKVPLKGVFICDVKVENKNYQAVTNVGTRPTVEGKNTLTEVHLLDFKGDLYGKRLEVTFLEKMRNEMKFASLDALKEQIAKDVESATAYFERRKIFEPV